MVTVVIFLCAKCFATWRVLPAFLARCLWRTWEVVEAVLFKGERQQVPTRTAQRWQGRLAQMALAATQALAISGRRCCVRWRSAWGSKHRGAHW